MKQKKKVGFDKMKKKRVNFWNKIIFADISLLKLLFQLIHNKVALDDR